MAPTVAPFGKEQLSATDDQLLIRYQERILIQILVGEWKSPIDVSLITGSTSTIDNLRKNEFTGDLFWGERNGTTNGRTTIMTRTADGTVSELTPEPFQARSHVHEYGGGVFTLGSNFLVSSNDADQRLYKVDLSTRQSTPLTPQSKVWRYADIEIHPSEKFLICVREDHTVDTPQTIINTLVVVRLDINEPNVEILAEGADFYSSPRFNPVNPSEFVYYSWDHPFMTWDHTQVYYNHLNISDDAVKIVSQKLLSGEDKTHEESANQPRFASDGTLYFVSDKSGFWNLYSYKDGGKVELVLQEPMKVEFQGLYHLAIIDTKDKTMRQVPIDFHVIMSVYTSTEGQDDILLLEVACYNVPAQVISYNLSNNTYEVMMKSSSVEVPKGYISKPESLTFKTTGGREAYALYYPPANPDYVAPERTLPPLRVLSHGGPTAAYTSKLDWEINYFTSRGIACIAVNYGGSTGYGRAFRNSLRTQWGVVDVDDCSNAATYLVERGDVDGNKLAVIGGSAGGYTTLACLAFRNVFNAGVSHYGICDLEVLAKDTHKFELRYPESLIGPYPSAREVYLERSPLYSADKINCPCAFFQGVEDKVVPSNQAELMVNALKKRGIPVAFVLFEGEGHGFRIPKNIRAALQGEISFLGRIFGFTAFDAIPIDISNEDAIGK
ncbi:Dipeptidyl aminopeptidase [Modicella reniformis]|uniref:Dipeptidyl aminopeptidase n=1 Tax=Modicella reniformis TaxID=1440133 RepID=A0A9P6SV09_9FUNG|nr:Dipeptidyl aminopeptidase [Modicella reniformis]